MLTSLPDDELLDVPVENLTPGELSRAFRVKAEHFVKKLGEEQSVRSDALKTHQQEQNIEDQEHEQLQRREEILLNQLRDREAQIFERAQELDKRTIKLDDGRRVYADKDKYRDAEGRELDDADRAQAEVHHLDQPNAATWQEHQAIAEQWKTTEALRQKVETLQAGGAPDETASLAAYEKEFAEKTSARDILSAGDGSSNTNYMAAYGLAPARKLAQP